VLPGLGQWVISECCNGGTKVILACHEDGLGYLDWASGLDLRVVRTGLIGLGVVRTGSHGLHLGIWVISGYFEDWASWVRSRFCEDWVSGLELGVVRIGSMGQASML
jgi:hypothetical protein